VSVMNTPRAICLALVLCWSVNAEAQIAVPTLSGRVTDETATLVVGVGAMDVLGCPAVLVDSVAATFNVWDAAESFFGAE